MDIGRLSLSELSGKALAGEISAEEAARWFLTRAHEQQQINAFIKLDDEGALARARTLDSIDTEARASMRLFGVPIAIKDNICVAGETTTCGSRILQHFVSPYNATVVEKLISAGAVILGKTNLDEFAMGSSTETSFFGITRNPHDLDRSPGGSSGGSTAAVAAGCAPCALGTDTGGSIRQPASFCGVVGLKPTYGRVSRYGLVAFAPSFDQIGPITRNVRDAALMLEVIAGHDPRDSTSVNRPVPEFSKLLDGDLSGLKVGVIKEHVEGGLTPLVAKTVQDAMLALERLGVEIIPVSLPHLNYAVAVYYILGTGETSSNLLRYDGVRYGHRASSYSDLVDMYRKTRREGFGQEVKRRIILGTFVLSTGYYEAYYLKAQRVRTLIIQDLRTAFERVDMLMGPTSPQEAFKIGEKIEDPLTMYLSDIFTIPANLAGLPAISIPYNSEGNALPVGVQLIARSFDEAGMLRVARALESDNSQTGKE
ncbi:MAG: Asp-tRNA(Asn)/Glu-tRNA(Gln) amidotransferase GatCAB subunit A [Candidatus Coatesbacteria bacterium]|nr:MAG: Asp-tRNA(Asn)/Glu-tRNA(Gln) amidotransferase GatCAB subunit A [Candidatus Coatesbacteria bacterium]HDM59777.1 Asp-tRNA(Asn)/Glu-tRNA(Gln) amidotransferase subunit GatA [Bacillota bacterium]